MGDNWVMYPISYCVQRWGRAVEAGQWHVNIYILSFPNTIHSMHTMCELNSICGLNFPLYAVCVCSVSWLPGHSGIVRCLASVGNKVYTAGSVCCMGPHNETTWHIERLLITTFVGSMYCNYMYISSQLWQEITSTWGDLTIRQWRLLTEDCTCVSHKYTVVLLVVSRKLGQHIDCIRACNTCTYSTAYLISSDWGVQNNSGLLYSTLCVSFSIPATVMLTMQVSHVCKWPRMQTAVPGMLTSHSTP